MFERIKALPRRMHASIDNFMSDRLGFSHRQKQLTWHYLKGLGDQCIAVIPISVLQVCSCVCVCVCLCVCMRMW